MRAYPDADAAPGAAHDGGGLRARQMQARREAKRGTSATMPLAEAIPMPGGGRIYLPSS